MDSIERLPEMTPQAYGTAVHVGFAAAVRFQDLPGIGLSGVETTLSLTNDDPHYGFPGSVRTDVILKNPQGDVLAIYDVKTGTKPLSPTRANELRTKAGARADTPVIELHIVRGATFKNIGSGWLT
jgi:hypothetical protein